MTWRRIALRSAALVVAIIYIAATAWHASTATATDCVEQGALHPLPVNHAQPVQGQIPVIFVHGITSSYQTWANRELNGTASISSRVASIPQTSVWGFDYSARSLDWVTNAEIGPRLARAITCLWEITGERVIVIDHSMGGLATQFAVAQSDGKGTVANHVAEVITLGTPYKGSKLLSAMQLAVKGGEDLADPELAVAAEGLLSACAGISEAGLAPGNANPCSLVGVLRSPVGAALQYNSREIAALPQWPSQLAVKDVDGNIDLTVSLFFARHTFDFGDIPVSHDSAVAHNTDGQPFDITCPMNGFTNIVSGSFLDCYHGNLPKNPQVVDYVVGLVNRIGSRQEPGPAPTRAASPPQTTTAQAAPTTTASPTSLVPTCSEWLQLSRSGRLGAVRAMQAVHHDRYPLLVAYASVRLFCTVYPNHRINGVYNGNL